MPSPLPLPFRWPHMAVPRVFVRRWWTCFALAACLVGSGRAGAGAEELGRLVVTTVENGGRGALPCRLHLADAAGKPVRVPGLPFFFDHVSSPGRAEVELPAGDYTYDVERGPEYNARSGRLHIEPGKDRTIEVALERLADLAAEGWLSGDLHIHRLPEKIEAVVRSEDLHVAPVITWWKGRRRWTVLPRGGQPHLRFDGDRFCDLTAGEDEREGGALLYFFLEHPLDLDQAGDASPPALRFALEARRTTAGCWIDAEKPFWWDFPVWVAHGAVDSVGIANNHMNRLGMYRKDEAWGRPRDKSRLPGPRGNGYYSQEIYYHLLESGLRIPPSAGSASGVLPNPVGYNRVYALVGSDHSESAWWNALRAGRSFVTNGPLLQVEADGFPPGHVFQARAGTPMTLELKARLRGRDPVRALEIVRDGRIERTVPAETLGAHGALGPLGSLRFESSGWFLVRALADNDRTFRFASTAPFYVEIGEKTRRVSRQSCRYFLEWVRQRRNQIALPEGPERDAVLQYHQNAEKFWQEQLARANCD